MTRRTTFLTTIALLLATGCSGASTEQRAGGNTTPNVEAAATSSADSESVTVDVAFLAGRWAENGNCAEAPEFRADGTLTPPEGSTYSLAGNVLTMHLNEVGTSPGPFNVIRTGADAMTLVADGESVRLTRCR